MKNEFQKRDGDALTFSATGLPAGLAIGSSTGRITGTPTTAGTSTVTVTVRDALASASQTFTWTLTTRDTTAPTKPASFAASAASGYPVLSWAASTDNIAVTGYVIYRSTTGSTQGPEVARTAASVRQWVDPAFQEKVAYTYSMKAIDAAGNSSALTALKTVTASQAPTPPVLSSGGLTGGKPTLVWTASTDNVGVTGYIVRRNSVEVARTTSLLWIDPTAVAGKSYNYNVRAFDAAGNVGTRSATITIRSQ